ncbi:2-amino-4-hydroxy-6-hydroxymethyldihydropteridine diphosphokinase [Solitalea koreensis]|uniref:2-amino-4-hydroxy-6-hydroxymethyldihydropteridine pyrophosphokinase n=1 Tax=Solitalea koreensis TaxID=543615 RepID=A0A521DAU8_9SPHI|nr:2-amino-4-hydroxy-6-hydroxymethyldihydropteridine diphosphokinase [Solitalea koreensis]SMO68201.1 2-amino-4-hydroxy-6-hydroxymethyldihydropteridinediphosphokinase [Solitalea koreensis]
MSDFYLLLGGNLGNREGNLKKAIDLLEERIGVISKRSSIYETAAWGKEDQPSFLNQAVCIQIQADPENILYKVLHIETDLGRERFEHWGSRVIDIDLLIADDLIINTQRLTLPHPQLQNRRFALIPLQEIAPDLIHPVFHKSVKDLLVECPDKLEVKKFQER